MAAGSSKDLADKELRFERSSNGWRTNVRNTTRSFDGTLPPYMEIVGADDGF